MTTDKTPATLATARHGGCVQLWDSITPAMVDAACNVLYAYWPSSRKDYRVNCRADARAALEAALAARQPVVVDLPESLHARVEALREVAACQPVGQIPAGFVLVPEKFGIPADVWEGVEFIIGGPGTGEDEAYLDSTVWIGDLIQDDGSSIYGLHLSCDECPEEGSVTLAEFAAPPAQAVDLGARPMETAPRDGTMVRLLVLFEEHATEDTAESAWTIGVCNDDHVGEDQRIGWQFAGWCWTHDHFTEGKGTPVGWLPLIDSQAVGK